MKVVRHATASKRASKALVRCAGPLTSADSGAALSDEHRAKAAKPRFWDQAVPGFQAQQF
jgi:hypothetical protein